LLARKTKAQIGNHDVNIDFESAASRIGVEQAQALKELTINLYDTAADFAKERGIILADTKFEFGLNSSGDIVLGDEALTPDSSRFWELSTWEPGGAQASFDKQFLRDYLVTSGWDRNSPPPELPVEIVEKTALRYEEAFYRITGNVF
jgi:phosphoribosylaminoimidazole-succinocarboxamide synthase